MSRNFELLQRLEQERTRTTSAETTGTDNARPRQNEAAYKPNLSTRGYEELNKLIQRLFVGSPRLSRMVAFTGSGPGVGCTWIVAHAAEVLSLQTSGTVCALEITHGGPGLRDYLAVRGGSGLTQALLEGGPIRNYLGQVNRNLWVLSRGESDPTKIALPSDRIESIVLELRREFDFILLDTTPLLGDSMMVARFSDGVVVVVKAGYTKRDVARLALEQLERANIKLLGTVLNQREYPVPDALYKRL